MSAAIAALASYGGSDSESDSGSDAEGRPGLSAQVAGADAVLHLAGPPPSAQQALLPVVDSAPAVSVKVRAGRRRHVKERSGSATNLADSSSKQRFPVFDGRLGIPSPPTRCFACAPGKRRWGCFPRSRAWLPPESRECKFYSGATVESP